MSTTASNPPARAGRAERARHRGEMGLIGGRADRRMPSGRLPGRIAPRITTALWDVDPRGVHNVECHRVGDPGRPAAFGLGVREPAVPGRRAPADRLFP